MPSILDPATDNIFDTINHNLGPGFDVIADYGTTGLTVTVNRLPEAAAPLRLPVNVMVDATMV